MSRGRLFGGLVGLALTAAVFAPGIGSEFTWDDHGLLRTNENVQDPARYGEALSTHFWNISTPSVEENEVYSHLYRPVVTLAYIVEYRLFGDDAAGYRLVSLALHLLCCLLCLLWLRRRIPELSSRPSWAALALGFVLFAMHPSRAEAVSWISGSTELWWAALLLGASLAFDGERRWAAGLLLALALLSKETAIVGAPLLLVDRRLRGGTLERRDVLALCLPVAVAFGLRTMVVGLGPPDAQVAGALGRVVASAGLYVQQVVAPLDPTVFRGMRIQSCDAASVYQRSWLITGGALVATTLGVTVAAWRRSEWRPALADLLFFLLPLLPVMNLMDLGSRNLTADRFLYVPLLGVAALVTRLLIALESDNRRIARILIAAFALLFASFAVVTSIHSTAFANSSSLWEYELERDPDNAMALHAVGTARVRAGLHLSGIALLERSLSVARESCARPDLVRAATNLAWAKALSTGPDQPAEIRRLARVYDGLPATGRLDVDASRGWTVELDASEVAELLADDRRHLYPRSLLGARSGAIDETRRRIAIRAEEGPIDADLRELSARLLAAGGDTSGARRELDASAISTATELPLLLDALDDALSSLPEEEREAAARFAMGYGPTARGRSTIPRGLAQELDALRALSTPGPHPPIRSQNEDLAALLRRDAELRALDEALLGER